MSEDLILQQLLQYLKGTSNNYFASSFCNEEKRKKTSKIKYSKQEKELFELYKQVYAPVLDGHSQKIVLEIHDKAKACYLDEWLLLQEQQECLKKQHPILYTTFL